MDVQGGSEAGHGPLPGVNWAADPDGPFGQYGGTALCYLMAFESCPVSSL